MTPTNDAPVTVEPDWLNADTCIENMRIAYDDATEDEDETPVDTVVSAGDLGVLIGLAEYAVRHRLAALASAPAGKLDRDFTARRIKELVDEGDGFWRACSGCQEGEDGYVSERDYPFDPLFRCQPGGGCSECGGIGVLWDDGRGYEDITGDEEPDSAPGGDGVEQELRDALAEIARLRLATSEGSLRVRADRMWEIADAALDRPRAAVGEREA